MRSRHCSWVEGDSVATHHDGSFRLFSRWDYDWFRIDTRMLDFYFLSRVSSATGDRTAFTYSPHTLLEDRFVAFYQPRICPRTQRVVAAEALCRLNVLDSIVLPGQFIDVAEAAGIKVIIGNGICSSIEAASELQLA